MISRILITVSALLVLAAGCPPTPSTGEGEGAAEGEGSEGEGAAGEGEGAAGEGEGAAGEGEGAAGEGEGEGIAGEGEGTAGEGEGIAGEGEGTAGEGEGTAAEGEGEGTEGEGEGSAGEGEGAPARCGDGALDPGEACDDGNTDDFDGCTSLCAAGVVCDDSTFPSAFGYAVDAATGHCYAASLDNLPWQAAQDACAAHGGYLAVIDSTAENDLVRNASDTSVQLWIGFNDSAVEAGTNDGGFVDVVGGNGTSDFDAFADIPDEPSGTPGENCVHFFEGSFSAGPYAWNDADCAAFSLRYACEFELNHCGDGALQPGEECDDGNRVDDDGCTNACTLPTCGDGIVQGGEECDDGNRLSGDGCDFDCVQRCGDGDPERFTFLERPSPANVNGQRGVAVVDVNGDGNLDVLSTADGNSALDEGLRVWLGNGDGSFAAPSALITMPASPDPFLFGIVPADLNGDGHVDVVVIGFADLSYVLLGDGAGNFTLSDTLLTEGGTRSDFNAIALIVADINRDGILDVLTRQRTGLHRLFAGHGDGTFDDFTNPLPAGGVGQGPSLHFVDVTGDGIADVVDVNSTTVAAFPGSANGTYGAPLLSGMTGQFCDSRASTLADLDGDGARDAVVTCAEASDAPVGSIRLLFGDKANPGHFVEGPVLAPNSQGTISAIAAVDVDGDGDRDLVTTHFQAFVGGGGIVVRENVGGGVFTGGTLILPTTPAGTGGRATAFADINKDGTLDFVSTRESNVPQSLRILLNVGGEQCDDGNNAAGDGCSATCRIE